MGFDLFFVNHTKKQIVVSKRLTGGFEDGAQLLAYLSMCNGDTIEIMGEGAGFIEKHVYDPSPPGEYRYIKLYEFKITDTYSSQLDQCGLNETEIDRLHDTVYNA